ncbi:YiiX/YebB-like N1pC/P60 family cysteine hydrolase [Gynuella sunshinyii]|uniref:Cell wall-associated hydrolase (Invasion-associated protein) n=1 Tax=Gynuella sunshinyii YC6258 TaxID=1445510 RepID=A0A0C5VHL7_9GAMM|nr:YiiX/YebB-like N1pC/P60 family cysteine hydrolase [Gynuella sunshinyii]AJQ92833.1 cell wall-associated hydrolase (invasion-associated protein) [Gynuella sunshinyii YC6258]
MNNNLMNGDIVFRAAADNDLAEAINDVTQTNQFDHYTHMGITEVKDQHVYIYHADPHLGVCCQALSEFRLSEQNEVLNIGVYRLTPSYQHYVDNALSLARTLIGQPYNHSYILDHQGFYCSEFIYHLFADTGLFTLKPMTFKQPGSDSFHPGWITYYRELGLEIPEGLPGCNPNEMAASQNLIKVF